MQGFSIAILCGGRSRRFGSDKTLTLLSGRPILQHVHQKLRKSSEDIFLVTKWNVPGKYQFLDIPIVYEPYEKHTPLFGIEQALIHAKYPWVLVVGADMPGITPEVIEKLQVLRDANTRLILPHTDRFHPLCAFYSKECLQGIKERIQHKQLRLQELSQMEGCRVVSFGSDHLRAFTNINTVEDLAQFEKKGQ
jgi:molybdopterin-guanine dinucleotide biosynthesis protein A